jgi:glycerate kinase
VTGSKDETMPFDEDQNEINFSSSDLKQVLIPPEVKPRYREVTIRLYCAQDLPLLGSSGMFGGKTN